MSILRCAMRTLRTCARRLCSHIVPAALDGLRVDVVSSRMSQLSRNRCGRLIAGGGLRVDGSPVRAAARRVRAGQRLDIDASVAFSDSAVHAEPSVPLALLHEDEHLVVVDKPAGIACHPVPGHSTGTLLNALLARYPELRALAATPTDACYSSDSDQWLEPDGAQMGIVHRLDAGTSGALVVARTAQAFAGLRRQWAARTVERAYTALVWGHPPADCGTIRLPLSRAARRYTLQRVAAPGDGLPAVTHWRVERRFHRPCAASLITCRLDTGRTHQIRVHLRSLGHPIVGDRDYGGGGATRRRGAAIDPGRPFLHAARLSFRHPASGKVVAVAAPLPPELTHALDRCDAESRLASQ